jgi:hypothetical protein
MSADPHKNATYLWEDSWPGWNRNHITLAECRSLIASSCLVYGVKRPIVVDHPQRSMSWNIPADRRISMQGGKHRARGGRNVATALHEAAHQIAFTLYGSSIQDHGPTWLGIYLDLLVRARGAPRIALEATLRAHGLKWSRTKHALPRGGE